METNTTQPPQPIPHVILVSTSDMGHLIPITEFAKRLLHEFTFTVVIATASPPTSGQISFTSALPAGIDSIFLPNADLSDAPSDARIVTLSSLAMARSLTHLRHLIADLVSKSEVVALVANLFSTGAFDVAVEFGLPCYVFFPSTAMCLSFLLSLEELDKTTSCEYAELVEPVNIPGCVPVRGRDLISSVLERKNDAYKWLLYQAKRYSTLAEGIIINTFEALEKGAVEMLSRPKSGKPSVYPVGPLIRTGSVESRDWSEISKWLDEQPRGSVLFVCFGSYWAHSSTQQTELALGLEMSEQRFLWVIKSPKDSKSQRDPMWSLPEGFLERTKGRGLVVPEWAPQLGVLSHESTGGFLSHCGWNSTLESVAYGMPMITWPQYAEQKMNAVVIAEELEVGLRLVARTDGVVGRDEIASVVRELIEAEGGKRIWTRMEELKNEASAALRKDGSSSRALEEITLKWKSK